MSDNNQAGTGTAGQGSQNNAGAAGAGGQGGGGAGAGGPAGGAAEIPKGSNQQPWMKVLNDDLAARGAGDGKPAGGKTGDKGTAGAAGGDAGAGGAGAAGGGDKTKTFQLDEKTLQGLIKQVADKGAAAGGAAAPKELSEAELNKMFNVYNADENILKALGLESTPERLGVLNTVLQAISKQSTTIASVQLQMALEKMKKEWEDEFTPVKEYMSTARQQQMRVRFFDQYPDLKGLEPLVLKVRDSFIAQKRTFESEDEAFKAVNDEVQALLSSVKEQNGDGGGDNGQGDQNRNKGKNDANGTGMPTLSGGGQGGTGANRSGGGASKPAWQKALGD